MVIRDKIKLWFFINMIMLSYCILSGSQSSLHSVVLNKSAIDRVVYYAFGNVRACSPLFKATYFKVWRKLNGDG